MKKDVIILVVALLLLLPFISAVEITFSKESYQPQETLQAEITGNFISLTENNIFIFKEGKAHEEPLIKGLTKQNNIYYFYAILPKQPGNYSFIIKAEYLERGEISSEPIIKPLIIEFKNTSDLSFAPGFVIPNKDFSIKVKSLFGNTRLKATFEATAESKELSLIEQLEETIKFKLPELFPGQSKIILNNYEIPVFLIKKINETTILEFIPYQLDGIITSNNKYYFTVLIKNTGNKPIEDITFSSDLNITFNPNLIKILQPTNITAINITISVAKIDKEKLEGKIITKTPEESFYLPVNFIITTNKSEVKLVDAKTSKSLSCSQLGVLCKENELCSGETVSSLEGACCIGQCIKEKKSKTSYIAIILIIILILIIIYFVWKKLKKRKIKSPEEILEERSERYQKRIEGKEVSGKLDKV